MWARAAARTSSALLSLTSFRAASWKEGRTDGGIWERDLREGGKEREREGMGYDKIWRTNRGLLHKNRESFTKILFYHAP